MAEHVGDLIRSVGALLKRRENTQNQFLFSHAMKSRPNWSTPLSHPVKPAHHKPLRTLADVRSFLMHTLPKEHLEFETWRHVGQELIEASESGDTVSVTVALEMVLVMNGVLERRG